MYLIKVIDLVDDILQGILAIPLQIKTDMCCCLVAVLHLYLHLVGNILQDARQLNILKDNRGFLGWFYLQPGVIYRNLCLLFCGVFTLSVTKAVSFFSARFTI